MSHVLPIDSPMILYLKSELMSDLEKEIKIYNETCTKNYRFPADKLTCLSENIFGNNFQNYGRNLDDGKESFHDKRCTLSMAYF